MTFSGVGNYSTGSVQTWQIGLLASKTTSEGGAVLETEQVDWEPSDPVSFDPETIGGNLSPNIRVPMVTSRTINRDGKTYVTTNTYRRDEQNPFVARFNDYARPYLVTETGDLTRQTQRVFFYANYFIDKISSETITVGSESFTKSYSFDPNTSFLNSQTILGITTNFTSDRGNVKTSTDAKNNKTTYGYIWGLANSIQTPEFTVTRVINPEGTVASETRRGFTTRFDYDSAFRLATITPPAGTSNPTTFEYDNVGGTFARTRRGQSVVTSLLDGFGRVSGTQNSVGVKTDVTVDACGRTTYQSYPFETTSVGTSFEFDGLGRLRRETHADTTFRTFDYSGSDVTITDEELRQTAQHWETFGDPAASRLATVRAC